MNSPKQEFRLDSGGRIDRRNLINFTFNGRNLSGYQGDTLASALLANGHHMVARSIKYHRPRGIFSAGLEEPSALVQCADFRKVFTPNLKVTEVSLSNGLVVESQNNWPSIEFDCGALLQLGSSLMTAGFYYKTFKWPQRGWQKFYEKTIRHIAGQGRISRDEDVALYDKRNLDCEILVIGSGPAGLNAALTAARAGASVALVDQDRAFGGSLLWEKTVIDKCSGHRWLQNTLEQLAGLSNVRLLPDTLAFGHYDHGLVLAVQHRTETASQVSWNIRAKRILLATGASERPVIFPGNDRPGVLLAGAVRQYISRYAVQPGKRAFLVIRDPRERAMTAESLTEAGIVISGCLEAGETLLGTKGRHRIRAVRYRSQDGSREHRSCDLLCVSAGWSPNAHLAAQMTGRLQFNQGADALVPEAQVGPLLTVGACRGVSTPQACSQDGRDQANVALAQLNLINPTRVQLTATDDRNQVNADRHTGSGKAFVDLQNDVTRADLELAVREGYGDVELAKRYTTLGMGTDQGKTSWTNGILELAYCVDKEPSGIGHTTYRPPYSPVSFGALAGPHTGINMTPLRRSPFHRVFESAGCVFQTSGQWLYSRYFPLPGESMEQSIEREVKSVRTGVGCVDMSTLGKVDVKGKDSLKFLSRLYCNNFETITTGRLRYVLMLREDGIIFDDGTVAQLGEDHFLVTMTTANSDAVWRWMTKLQQTQWPELDVSLTAVTDHWASLAIAGPCARNLLYDLKPDFPVDAESFPFASVREGYLNESLPCRVFSVSFSGESSFEINVPAAYARAIFNRVLDKGNRYGITPYGLEALDVLRIEKGHLSVGTEIDGRTVPTDLGMEKMVSRKKNFIGRALLERPGLMGDDRPNFVGLKSVDSRMPIPRGAHLVTSPWSPGNTQSSLGTLTAAVWSPTLEHPIGLALLHRGRTRINERLWAVSPVAGDSVEVVVESPCFYDPGGARVHG
jgi:sarcosine oxidase subunit alpha